MFSFVFIATGLQKCLSSDISLCSVRSDVYLNDSLVTLSTAMGEILFVTQDIYSDRHEALIIVI